MHCSACAYSSFKHAFVLHMVLHAANDVNGLSLSGRVYMGQHLLIIRIAGTCLRTC